MSILDALKVQKANQRSIAELAALPQDQIIKLAQMGQIPSDVVPVVINEKARMAREMANLQAARQMQGGEPPTVIEQAMQANAQQEIPMDTGVASIPVDNMFQDKSFAGGGIVAFNGEDSSFVRGPTGLMMLPEDLERQEETQVRRPRSLEQVLASVKSAYGGEETAALTPERQAYLDALKAGSMSPEERQKQIGLRFVQAGLGTLAGKSPYAFENIGRGSAEALQGYMEDLKTQRTQGLAEKKAAADVADLRRAERRQEVASGLDMYGKELEREQRERLASERSATSDRYAKNYARMKKNAGDPRSEEELLNEGYLLAFQEQAQALRRIESTAATAAAGQGIQITGQAQTEADRARSARLEAERIWGSKKILDPDRQAYDDLVQKDRANAKAGKPTNLAEEFKERRIREMMSSSAVPVAPTGGAAAPRPSGGTAPAKPDISKITGAPAGSTIGSFVSGKGWEIKDRSGNLLGYAK